MAKEGEIGEIEQYHISNINNRGKQGEQKRNSMGNGKVTSL